MAKDMAKLNVNGVVINIEWCSDKTVESDTLKEINDYPVAMGDIYESGYFYRNGEKVLTPLEEITLKYDELNTSYQEGINSI